MTMSPGELQRKVRQMDNDVSSLYEMLVGIQATLARHGNALAVIVARQDDHDQRFDSLDLRLTAIDDRLDSHDDRFDAIDARLDSHTQRFDAIDAHLGRLEEGMTEVLTLLRAG